MNELEGKVNRSGWMEIKLEMHSCGRAGCRYSRVRDVSYSEGRLTVLKGTDTDRHMQAS